MAIFNSYVSLAEGHESLPRTSNAPETRKVMNRCWFFGGLRLNQLLGSTANSWCVSGVHSRPCWQVQARHGWSLYFGEMARLLFASWVAHKKATAGWRAHNLDGSTETWRILGWSSNTWESIAKSWRFLSRTQVLEQEFLGLLPSDPMNSSCSSPLLVPQTSKAENLDEVSMSTWAGVTLLRTCLGDCSILILVGHESAFLKNLGGTSMFFVHQSYLSYLTKVVSLIFKSSIFSHPQNVTRFPIILFHYSLHVLHITLWFFNTLQRHRWPLYRWLKWWFTFKKCCLSVNCDRSYGISHLLSLRVNPRFQVRRQPTRKSTRNMSTLEACLDGSKSTRMFFADFGDGSLDLPGSTLQTGNGKLSIYSWFSPWNLSKDHAYHAKWWRRCLQLAKQNGSASFRVDPQELDRQMGAILVESVALNPKITPATRVAKELGSIIIFPCIVLRFFIFVNHAIWFCQKIRYLQFQWKHIILPMKMAIPSTRSPISAQTQVSYQVGYIPHVIVLSDLYSRHIPIVFPIITG